MKKIIAYVIVIVLVVLISGLFVYLFWFERDEEKNSENVPKVTEELVNRLYSYIPDNEMNLQSMYTGYYVTINNMSSPAVQSILYKYILNYEEDALESITNVDSQDNSLTINAQVYTPVNKISVSEFNAVFPIVFGDATLFNIDDFLYDYDTLLNLNDTFDYYFVYNIPLENTNNDIVFRDIVRYAVTDNGQTIEIYDYYLKCDLNNNNCYNNERKTELNSSIKYSNNFNINNYSDLLTIYKHTYKYNNGNYYWFSSEVA